MSSHTSDDADRDARARALVDRLAAEAAVQGMADTWYCVAACAFAACNEGAYVADVYRAAVGLGRPTRTDEGAEGVESIEGVEVPPDMDMERARHVLRRLKEGLLKTGVIYGIPRVINAFRALMGVLAGLPVAANETTSVRRHIAEPATTDARGLAYMRNIFRADLDPFLQAMDGYWPDLRTLVVTFIYGYYQSDTAVLDAVATSQLNIATLVPMDVTAEVAWHMRGLIRNGGSRAQIDYAYDVALAVCAVCDVRLKNTMPRPEDVVNEERLF